MSKGSRFKAATEPVGTKGRWRILVVIGIARKAKEREGGVRGADWGGGYTSTATPRQVTTVHADLPHVHQSSGFPSITSLDDYYEHNQIPASNLGANSDTPINPNMRNNHDISRLWARAQLSRYIHQSTPLWSAINQSNFSCPTNFIFQEFVSHNCTHAISKFHFQMSSERRNILEQVVAGFQRCCPKWELGSSYSLASATNQISALDYRL